MVPLSGLRAHRLAPHWHRVAHVVWSLGRRFDNFQGLRTFKGKFDPTREPRYLAASGWFGPYLALIDIVALIGGGIRVLASRRAIEGGRRSRLGIGGYSCDRRWHCARLTPIGIGARKQVILDKCMSSIQPRNAWSDRALFRCARLDFGIG